MEIECVLNHSHRLRSEDHFSDFEFEVEQVIADGFEDGESLDIAEVEPVLGNFEITADFFFADDLRRKQWHVGNLLPKLLTGIEE